MTFAERRLWRVLREALPGEHWRKQVPLGPYIADFCSHGSKLIIEVDGGQHAQAADHDARRTHFIEREGFRVLRFWNNDVIENLDGVLGTIATALLPVPQGEGRGEGDQTCDDSALSLFRASPSVQRQGEEL